MGTRKSTLLQTSLLTSPKVVSPSSLDNSSRGWNLKVVHVEVNSRLLTVFVGFVVLEGSETGAKGRGRGGKAKQSTKLRTMTKTKYTFLRAAKKTEAYQNYFNPDPKVEKIILGLSDLVCESNKYIDMFFYSKLLHIETKAKRTCPNHGRTRAFQRHVWSLLLLFSCSTASFYVIKVYQVPQTKIFLLSKSIPKLKMKVSHLLLMKTTKWRTPTRLRTNDVLETQVTRLVKQRRSRSLSVPLSILAIRSRSSCLCFGYCDLLPCYWKLANPAFFCCHCSSVSFGFSCCLGAIPHPCL